jgi:hypothetical protein
MFVRDAKLKELRNFFREFIEKETGDGQRAYNMIFIKKYQNFILLFETKIVSRRINYKLKLP